jgi:hypothetical protein
MCNRGVNGRRLILRVARLVARLKAAGRYKARQDDDTT